METPTHTFRPCHGCASTGSVDREYDAQGRLVAWRACQACDGSGARKVALAAVR